MATANRQNPKLNGLSQPPLTILLDPTTVVESAEHEALDRTIKLLKEFNPTPERIEVPRTQFAMLARALHMETATLVRYSVEGKSLKALQSIMAIEIFDLYRFGKTIFKTETRFEEWLAAPSPLLDNQRPTELLSTLKGLNAIQMALNAIAGGVYT
jgi:putative toxin-antitoxin system antitoxin component (TIGR02293 family)